MQLYFSKSRWPFFSVIRYDLPDVKCGFFAKMDIFVLSRRGANDFLTCGALDVPA